MIIVVCFVFLAGPFIIGALLFPKCKPEPTPAKRRD